MKQYLVILFLFFSTVVFSQQKNAEQLEREARENVREGNMLYNQLKFSEAEIAYKKAISKNPNYPKASYNLGNAVYHQQRNKEAVNQFELVEKTFTKKMDKAEAYHNMGNSFMNEKQYDKAVEAYKNSLRNNSKDDETRYNYAMAKELLKQQQNQQNKDDKKENKDKKDQKNKDKQEKDGGDKEKEQDKKNQDEKENDKTDPNKNKDKKEEDKKKQPRPNQLTPEQMKQLLEAMNNEENKTQKKLNAKTAKGIKTKQEKDW